MGLSKNMSIVASTASCVGAGTGLATTWALAGSTSAYTGTLETDGYQLTASLVWANPGTTTTTAAGGTGESNTIGTTKMGMGTCVETLDSSGVALATTVTDQGNMALCHFIYWTFKADTVALYAASTGTYDWGATMYMNTTQWGTAASGIKGTTMN